MFLPLRTLHYQLRNVEGWQFASLLGGHNGLPNQLPYLTRQFQYHV
jgi:hypothetical protein